MLIAALLAHTSLLLLGDGQVQRQVPHRVFILGVAHQNPGDLLFNVSLKDFETPLGLVENEKAIAKKLQAAAGGDVVLAEWTISAERRSDGAVVEWEGMSVCELRDGRISWWREYYDDPDALRQARTA